MAAWAWSRHTAAANATINFFMIASSKTTSPFVKKGLEHKRPTRERQVIWMMVCMMVLSVEMVLAFAW